MAAHLLGRGSMAWEWPSRTVSNTKFKINDQSTLHLHKTLGKSSSVVRTMKVARQLRPLDGGRTRLLLLPGCSGVYERRIEELCLLIGYRSRGFPSIWASYRSLNRPNAMPYEDSRHTINEDHATIPPQVLSHTARRHLTSRRAGMLRR